MTQKLLRALPLLSESRSCLADHQCCYSFYLGKKVAFVYRAHREIRGTKIRVIWGKVTRPHGTHNLWVSHDVRFLNKVARQLWRREGTIPTQSSSQIIRRLGQSDAVSVIDLVFHGVTKMGQNRHCGACC